MAISFRVWPVRFDRVYLDAAEMLMCDPELARTMPSALKKDVKARRKARKLGLWRYGGVDRASAL